MDGWEFLRLINALRQAAIAISVQDVCEAQICLERFPFIPVKQICKTLLIHKPQDLLTFETVWRVLFEPTGDADNDSDLKDRNLTAGLKPDEEGGQHPNIGGQGIGRGLGGVSLNRVSGENILSSLQQFNTQKLKELLKQGTEFEELINTVFRELDYFTWINSFELEYRKGSLSEEDWFAHLDLRRQLTAEVRQQVLTLQVAQENSWQPLLRQHWLYKSLNSLSEQEKGLVKSALKKWARKLAVRPGQRWRASHSGVIDVARSIRQSAQWNGRVFRLEYHKKTPRVPELVVLCDVSNSMAPFVEFLLYLVSCLRKRFHKIRVYFFIDKVWEVSELVWAEDLENIQQEISSYGHKISLGFSDYGAVFKELADSCLGDVSPRASIVLLGDGKNNYRSAQEEYIRLLAERVRHIYWLNPLNVEEWSDPDNIMKVYRPFYTRAYRCRSADDLHKIARDVF